MKITRQDPETSSGMTFFVIKLSGTSYRFFIDVGVLFWEEGTQNPEEDLDDGEAYQDILAEFRVPAGNVKFISMRKGTLSIKMGSETILFVDTDDSTFIKLEKRR